MTSPRGSEKLVAMARRGVDHELNAWLERHGYRPSHARVIESPVTGRPVFAAHERDGHITTRGRRALTRSQFALPPGPEEKRRGIKGRLPIDDIERARSALGRAKQMYKRGHISAREFAQARSAVHKAWPSMDIGST